MKWLPTNPVPMEGRLKRCWLFAYRAPLEEVAKHLPPELKPISFGGFGFWNVVVCEVEHMRPLHFPESLGITYRHAAYRIYVRHHNASGASVDGLYFLRSDCDNPLLAAAGNALTQFKFHLGKIDIRENPVATMMEVDAQGAHGEATISYTRKPTLAEGSPFRSVQEAAEFLEYQPHGISVSARGVEVLPVLRNQARWRTSVVTVSGDHWEYLDQVNQGHLPLEVAYELAPIDYVWGAARKVA